MDLATAYIEPILATVCTADCAVKVNQISRSDDYTICNIKCRDNR